MHFSSVSDVTVKKGNKKYETRLRKFDSGMLFNIGICDRCGCRGHTAHTAPMSPMKTLLTTTTDVMSFFSVSSPEAAVLCSRTRINISGPTHSHFPHVVFGREYHHKLVSQRPLFLCDARESFLIYPKFCSSTQTSMQGNAKSGGTEHHFFISEDSGCCSAFRHALKLPLISAACQIDRVIHVRRYENLLRMLQFEMMCLKTDFHPTPCSLHPTPPALTMFDAYLIFSLSGREDLERGKLRVRCVFVFHKCHSTFTKTRTVSAVE